MPAAHGARFLLSLFTRPLSHSSSLTPVLTTAWQGGGSGGGKTQGESEQRQGRDERVRGERADEKRKTMSAHS